MLILAFRFALVVVASCLLGTAAMAQFEIARLVGHDGNACVGTCRYGSACDVDGQTTIVGAPEHDGVGADAGAAYVFREEPGGWIEEAKLTASDPVSGAFFGFSVAIAGDWAFVGAPRADGIVSGCGAVYVFRRTGAFPFSTWTQQAKVFAADLVASQWFGEAMSASGQRILVGAIGCAYVFSRTGTVWAQQSKLVPSGQYQGSGLRSTWTGIPRL